MSYLEIDPRLEKWCVYNNINLIKQNPEGECRYFYTRNFRGECFQISIGLPKMHTCDVYIFPVETLNDSNIECSSKISVNIFGNELDNILQFINNRP
jgi:hypothetical protein